MKSGFFPSASLAAALSIAFLFSGWICSFASGAELSTITELEALCEPLQPRNVSIKFDGTVLWSNPSEGRIILQDRSAAYLFELQLPGRVPGFGERIRLEGEAAAVKSRDAILLSSFPVVENNGLHELLEQSGSLHLEAGKHPVQVIWFNRTGEYGLELEYEGPGIERQPIPDSELYRTEHLPDSGETEFVQGLEYRCIEGQWWRLLPNFDHMKAVRSGEVNNFNTDVKTRDSHVGLQFSGFINIQRTGNYTFHLSSDDGSRLFIGPPTLAVASTPAGSRPAIVPPPQRLSDAEFLRAEVEGDILAVKHSGDALELELMTESGLVNVKVADATGLEELKLHQRIHLTGVSRRVRSLNGNWVQGQFFVQSLERVIAPAEQSESGEDGLPLLISIGQIYQLNLEESSRKYPVKVRGVITSPMENNGAVLQDSGRGIYVALNGPVNLRVGDYCEIEGTTGPYTFSHYIEATSVEVLGAGVLPDPVQPSWDQLINGSLHCNYVELEGVIASVEGNVVTLLTRGGRINVRLNPAGPPVPQDAKGATVQIRGCLLADWDGYTRRVVMGSIYIDQQWITIVEPAPADPFSVGYKRVDDLLQFDPQAGALQRLRVYGILVYKGDEICCLMDGHSGLRFAPVKGMDAEVGDWIDASGFLELGKASPVLREAVTRTVGQAELPAPNRLLPDALVQDEYDSTLTTVEAVLLDVSEQPGRTVLELQSGLRRFMAELNGELTGADLLPGSRLELTGAYIGLGGNRILGRPIDSFKLLLNSEAGITVLSRPPWWTLQRLLTVVGLLAAVLIAAAIWIKLLRRTVEERTEELGNQIRERQLVEHQHEIEQERARVAHDLHDDLGARLTEVNMLATLVNNPYNTPEDRSKYADQLKAIALHMVTALDEIVWAVNPRNDTVSSLAGYFGAHAQRLLELASINCGLDVDDSLPMISLDPRSRREIFLAFKEALANIIQHADAEKVWLRVFVQDKDLVVELSDDGSGFDPAERKAGSDGLVNMQERLAALGGRCTIESEPGKGTTIRLQAPLQGTEK